jgi:hypothetical protein
VRLKEIKRKLRKTSMRQTDAYIDNDDEIWTKPKKGRVKLQLIQDRDPEGRGKE